MEFSNSYMPSSNNPECRIHHVDKENPDVLNVKNGEEIKIKKYDSRTNLMENVPCEDEPVCPIKVEGENPEEMISSHFLEPQCAISEDEDVILEQSNNLNRTLGSEINNEEFRKQTSLRRGQIQPANWKHPPTADRLEPFLCKQSGYANRFNFSDSGDFYSQEVVEFVIPEKSNNAPSSKLDSRRQQKEIGDETQHSIFGQTLDKDYLEKQKFTTSHGKNMYQCPECPYTTPHRTDLKVHLMVHTGDKPFGCSSCEFNTTTSGTLKKHMRLKHTGERPYKCHECEAVFKTNRNLRSHMMMHNGEKPFACSECDYKSTKNVNLTRHMFTHTGEKNFRCKECGYNCVSKRSLSRHMMRHTGETPYSCPECDYACIQKETLTKHILSHTGERPFKCSQCTADFRACGDLNRHMLVHTGEKPFGCDVCNYRTNKVLNLKRHALTHTGEKPFACPYCEYKCTENRILTNHIMGHTGEKPLSCPYCEYRCTEKRLLKKHVIGHICPYCEYRCTVRKLLKEHVMAHMNADGTYPERCMSGNVEVISNLPAWPSGLSV